MGMDNNLLYKISQFLEGSKLVEDNLLDQRLKKAFNSKELRIFRYKNAKNKLERLFKLRRDKKTLENLNIIREKSYSISTVQLQLIGKIKLKKTRDEMFCTDVSPILVANARKVNFNLKVKKIKSIEKGEVKFNYE